MRIILIFLMLAPTVLAATGTVTGLPLPRFVSIKKNEANIRTGPGTRYPIEWVFIRKNLPVEVIAEYSHWRKIRDYEGVEGWIHKALLSSKRTGILIGDGFALRKKPSFDSAPVIRVGATKTGIISSCQEGWCRINIDDDFDGWVHHDNLWGISLDEAFGKTINK